MPQQSFDYCALHYLNQFIERDEPYGERLLHGTRYTRLVTLQDAATFYKVARNLRTVSKLDKKHDRYLELRYGRLLDFIDRFSRDISKDKIVSHTIKFEKVLRRSIYKPNMGLLSLSTKMLWQVTRSPSLIYDQNVCLSLDLGPAPLLQDFHDAWRARFSENESEIIRACERLPSNRRYAQIPQPHYDDDDQPHALKKKDIRRIVNKPFFRERVFDMYLWHKRSSLPTLTPGGAVIPSQDSPLSCLRIIG
ncbi:MAG: hypothetical protein WD672_06175 [Woeseia sp.]